MEISVKVILIYICGLPQRKREQANELKSCIRRAIVLHWIGLCCIVASSSQGSPASRAQMFTKHSYINLSISTNRPLCCFTAHTHTFELLHVSLFNLFAIEFNFSVSFPNKLICETFIGNNINNKCNRLWYFRWMPYMETV